MKIILLPLTILLNLTLTKSFSQDSLLWATYYGGTGSDMLGNSIAVDHLGNIYLAGTTTGSTGLASSGFQNTFGGGSNDGYLVKFNPSGNRLWATYYGGTGDDACVNVATDHLGNVYICGITGSASGIASGGFQNTYGGSFKDAFLAKFDSFGNRLWATYYGGTGPDNGSSVATDPLGNVYLSGGTTSTTGIASGGFQNTISGTSDAFLVKFDSSGNRLWSTYYGGTGSGGENGLSVAIDSSSNVYLAGETSSASGIASGGFQNTYGGSSFDAYLVKFNSAGNRLWATYYGGADEDRGRGVTTDSTGNIYLIGWTKSTANIASGGFQNTYGGFFDGFLVKFDSTGNRLWATYYGDVGNGYAENAIVDRWDNIYLVGAECCSGSSLASGGYQNTSAGDYDAYLAAFDALGNRICATYFGGPAAEGAFSFYVDTDPLGNVFLSGMTQSSLGIAYGGFQNAYGGNGDGFLTKFSSCGNNIPLNTSITSKYIPISIFPNPFSEQTVFQSDNLLHNATLTVDNCFGQTVTQLKNINGQTVVFNRDNLASGLYFVQLTADSTIYTDKLVITDK